MPFKDREAYNAYMNEYMKQRYAARRAEAIKILGGKCVKCGSIKELEIDHRKPEEKEIDLGKLWSIKWERVLEELKKCQLLCNEHHQEKSNTEQGYMPP